MLIDAYRLLFDAEIVTVKVGKELMSFSLHKRLLCTRAPYFKKAFESGFKESQEGVIEFPEVRVETFKLFHLWLYAGVIWEARSDQEVPTGAKIIQLYIFADMLAIHSLANTAMCQLMTAFGTHQLVWTDQMNYVWENTVASSPLRRFLVDLCVRELRPEAFVPELFSGNREICLEIMQAFSKKHSLHGKPLLQIADYYVPEIKEEVRIGGNHK
jgi:hypothetical protein